MRFGVVAKNRLLASFFCCVGACVSVKQFRGCGLCACSCSGLGFRG